jgi:hypothetical protein
MNYQAFTSDSLTMMYEGIGGALAADDALKRQGMEARFRVRETSEWKLHAAELERKCSGAERCSRSSTGQRTRRRYRFRIEVRSSRCPFTVPSRRISASISYSGASYRLNAESNNRARTLRCSSLQSRSSIEALPSSCPAPSFAESRRGA